MPRVGVVPSPQSIIAVRSEAVVLELVSVAVATSTSSNSPCTPESAMAVMSSTSRGGGTGTSTCTAAVHVEVPVPPPLEVLDITAIALSGVQGELLDVDVATATDTNSNTTASDLTAIIDWGDGTTPTLGIVTQTAQNQFLVHGSHTYADPGTFTLSAKIEHQGRRSN